MKKSIFPVKFEKPQKTLGFEKPGKNRVLVKRYFSVVKKYAVV